VAADAPILRAIPEAGQVWNDPSEDVLFILLEDIEAGEGNFLIVERTNDPTNQTYVQAAHRQDGSYDVEYRQCSADRHYRTVAPDMRAAHALLTGWAFDLDGWREQAEWSPVSPERPH